MASLERLRIGTAGWTIPRVTAGQFPAEGSSLQRYAARFDAAEINSTFHRSHRPTTYLRWAESTPADFRFAVKLARTITHDAKLERIGDLLDVFLLEARLLGERLGPLLVQLPPSLAFDSRIAGAFFEQLRARWDGAVACEPRHASWFTSEADSLLRQAKAARVAADPARHAGAGSPGGWTGLAYWRLHGSPRVYYSSYPEAALDTLAQALASSEAAETWCVFDNTASGAAAADALALKARLGGGESAL
jgi:uncharacterized protein YecE (DUF72 family)